MLASARKISVGGVEGKTPLLVPSFSSKGFPNVQKIIDTMSHMITECMLISAYDIAHGNIKEVPPNPEIIFLDSGGYECSKDMDLSDQRTENYQEQPWIYEELVSVLDAWSATQPTVAVSYDHPKQRSPIKEQIARAHELFKGRSLGKEILIKPVSMDARRINIDEIIAQIHDLSAFDVIGLTEKELGYSLFDRMKNIGKLRLALTKAGLETPIHIFGSLDTISTPLYFFSGADIFDGLTWLRYSYYEGLTVYQKNAANLMKTGLRMNDDSIDPKVWAENYLELGNMQASMHRYLHEEKFACFKRHDDFFDNSVKELFAALKI